LQAEADVLVLSVPLYFYSVPGKFKDYLDRQLPLFVGAFRKAIGTRPMTESAWPEGVRVVLISPCGFPQLSNFDALSLAMRKTYGRALSEELLVPFAHAISQDHDGTKMAPLYALLRELGREFVQKGALSQESRTRFEQATTPDSKRAAAMAERLNQSAR
jgi:hypothetical protein